MLYNFDISERCLFLGTRKDALDIKIEQIKQSVDFILRQI